VSDQLSRRVYLERTLQNVYRRLEKDKRQGTPGLTAAIDSMGEEYATWRTTDLTAFTVMVNRLAKVHAILTKAYVEDPWYAKWRMMLWRRKRSVLMQHFNKVIRRVARPDQPIVFGTGDGGFAAMGRGERSVPTKGARAELRRALRARMKVFDRHTNTAVVGRPGVFTYLPEQRTTMCCCRCGKVLRNVIDPATGFALRGLKMCHNCGACSNGTTQHWCRLDRVADDTVLRDDEMIKDGKGEVVRGLRLCVVKEHDNEHAHRLLNRDVNAARNIWLILDAVLFGRPRPAHLVIQRKAKKITPAVDTAT
jgi:hypothetical protein